ncbi:hypothetical protein [Motiliproteus sp.]|uniref:hypothetical protein n=1 Tax=Motiliproteus sp. TaxID=1898955 RepID=UPI003BA99DF4
MYQQFFGLNELPFTLTPNTHYFLNLPTHQEALNLILVALENGDGLSKSSVKSAPAKPCCAARS